MTTLSSSSSPWNLVRRWPCDAPLAVHLDQPDEQVTPTIRISSPAAATQTGELPDLGPSESSHCALFVLGYELGRLIEPAARHSCSPADDRSHPLSLLQQSHWELESDWHGAIRSLGGDFQAAEQILGRLRPDNPVFTLHMPQLDQQRRVFQAGVERVLEYIRAGDVYQVNLTHRITARLVGSARAFAARFLEQARPRHGAYREWVDQTGRRRAIVSASPELFLRLDPRSRQVQTRPMKGTRAAHVDAAELASSPKDRAELNMIVDLMRNDLGRVCQPGTVRVSAPFQAEQHAGSVLQSTATIVGILRAGVDLRALFAATFPPGSVTGAPKIRAMQIIEELEPVRRGPYCGCIGRVGADGSMVASVAIRTACLKEIEADQWLLDFPVGAGIVADSNPDAEWDETMLKADVLLRMARDQTSSPM